MKKETVYTISSRLGLSASTVSRVLAGKGQSYRISPSTVRRVLEEAESCGYLSQTGSDSRNNGLIGLVIPDMEDPYYARLVSCIVDFAQESGYLVIPLNSHNDDRTATMSCRSLARAGVRAILAVPDGSDVHQYEKIEKGGIPVVFVDHYFENCDLPYVTTNNYKGGYEATSKLLSAGHRNIACVLRSLDIITNRDRASGYGDAMAYYGCSGQIITGGLTIEESFSAVRSFLKANAGITAIFACSNENALGAMMAVKSLGLVVPDDISLITFDKGIHLDPSISAIYQPIKDIADISVRIVIKKINGERSLSNVILLPDFYEGNSVKNINTN